MEYAGVAVCRALVESAGLLSGDGHPRLLRVSVRLESVDDAGVLDHWEPIVAFLLTFALSGLTTYWLGVELTGCCSSRCWSRSGCCGVRRTRLVEKGGRGWGERALTSLLALPSLLKYRAVHEGLGLARSLLEIEGYSADMMGLVSASSHHSVWSVHDGFRSSEGQLSPGLTVAVLFAAALWRVDGDLGTR